MNRIKNFLLSRGKTTSGSHTADRNHRIRWTIAVSLVSRAIIYSTTLLSVPLTIHYLGAEQFGIWITLSTSIMWLMVLDFGLGNGLRNLLSEAYGKGQRQEAQEYFSTTFWMLCGVALVLGLILAGAFRFVPWTSVFNASSSISTSELNWAVAIVLGTFVLRFPLSIVNVTYSSYQEGYISALWEALSGLASLAALWLVTRGDSGLAQLALALCCSALVVNITSVYFLLVHHKSWLRPRFSNFKLSILRKTFSTSLRFMAIQIAALIVYQTDNMVITQVLGPHQVTPYNLAFRVFWLIISLQSLIVTPLWPAYSEAAARGDFAWMRRQLRRSVTLSMAFGGSAVLVAVLVGQPAIALWIRASDGLPSQPLMFLMGLWTLLYVWQSPFSMFLNGLGSIKWLSRIAIWGALLNLFLSISFAKLWGLNGIVIANTAVLCIGAVQGPFESWYRLNTMINCRADSTTVRNTEFASP